MKTIIRFKAVVCLWVVLFGVSAARAAEQDSTELDPADVYRVQPSVEGSELVRVAAEEIKPGLVYYYYNGHLGRHVWGFAREDGSFQYAFGPGTTFPTDRFDFRIATSVRSEILQREAPGLERDLQTSGRVPTVQLDAAGRWRLYKQTSTPRMFDLESGHRWEWHGQRRVAVLHTHGDLWTIVDGHFRPADGDGFACLPDCGCCSPRAGSAALVFRTGEPLPQ